MLCAKEFVNDAVACDTVLAGALANTVSHATEFSTPSLTSHCRNDKLRREKMSCATKAWLS